MVCGGQTDIPLESYHILRDCFEILASWDFFPLLFKVIHACKIKRQGWGWNQGLKHYNKGQSRKVKVLHN